jgi:hypothetical protein
MTNLRAIIVAALVVTPSACTHDERPPQEPEKSAPAEGKPSPAPNTTNEPSEVESPKLNESPRQSDPTGTAPVSDSRTLITPFKVSQTSGGSSSGGFGGMPNGGVGGSIVTAR